MAPNAARLQSNRMRNKPTPVSGGPECCPATIYQNVNQAPSSLRWARKQLSCNLTECEPGPLQFGWARMFPNCNLPEYEPCRLDFWMGPNAAQLHSNRMRTRPLQIWMGPNAAQLLRMF